ncbi:MAG: 4-phosphopantetheinyl transferase [Variovorax sp.]|nr:4-phosphopantetheinyl transferase [Variovorax sp.]
MTIRLLPSQASCLLWQIDLDEAPAPAALALLSPEEQARAQRFVFERDARRFIAAHVALRKILGKQAGMDGKPLHLVEGHFGKPAVAGLAGLHFNLSHSQGVGLIALSRTFEVGVDVEVLRPMPDALSLAQAHFTHAECAALAALPEAMRERAFFTCWTRKEACLKALGVGLQLSPASFEVGVAPVARMVNLATPEGMVRLALDSFSGLFDHGAQTMVFSLARRMVEPRGSLAAPAGRRHAVAEACA